MTSVNELKNPDMIVLPGSKNTMGDLKWLRESGLETAVKKMAERIPVFGICGGYQMLGKSIADPDHAEEGGEMRGMELLPIDTVLLPQKTRRQVEGRLNEVEGIFAGLSGQDYTGYEIHMGDTVSDQGEKLPQLVRHGNVYGTYIHSIFDKGGIVTEIVKTLAKNKGIDLEKDNAIDYAELKEREYDKLADVIRSSMDMDAVYGMLRESLI